MLLISKGRVRVKVQVPLLLANNATADLSIFGLPNSLDVTMDENGWTTIPYGMWPHDKGYQRFGMKQAEAIVDAFKSLAGKFKRVIVGLPVFKGHPDNPEFANKYRDKTEYGQVADMEANDDGLRLRQVLSNGGSQLVSNGLDRISPNWYVRDTGETKNGRPIYEPTSIKSVGLVDKPNIPNLSLVNHASPSTPMNKELLKLLGLADDATDEQISTAVTALSKRPTEVELANVKNEKSVLETKVTELTKDRDSEKNRADLGAQALANEKTSRIKTSLDAAIKSGKIVAADRASWEKMLAVDVEVGLKLLGNAKPTIKTIARVDSATAAEADRKAREAFANGGADGADPEADGNATAVGNAKRIRGLMADEMKVLGDCMPNLKGNAKYNRAWANLKKAHPNLFTDGAKSKPDDSENE